MVVMEISEPSGFWTSTHTEISWTDVDTLKLADGKAVPLLETLYKTGPFVWFPDTVLTLSFDSRYKPYEIIDEKNIVINKIGCFCFSFKLTTALKCS